MFKLWLEKNNPFANENITQIGVELSFYIPAKKLSIKKEDKSIKKLLHNYFTEKHNAYTLETVKAFGYWRKNSSEPIVEDENVKYVICLKEDQISDLITFLSKLCSIMDETIYLNKGAEGWLVSPSSTMKTEKK